MAKVRARYHFLDKKALRNRKQGDVFEAPEAWAKELEAAGLVVFLDRKPAAKSPAPPPPAKSAKEEPTPKREVEKVEEDPEEVEKTEENPEG